MTKRGLPESANERRLATLGNAVYFKHPSLWPAALLSEDGACAHEKFTIRMNQSKRRQVNGAHKRLTRRVSADCSQSE